MPEITDDDILATADRLTRDAGLDSAQRDAVVLAVQRLLWPPSPHPFLHSEEHISLSVHRLDRGGWTGQLNCPHGCGRRWRVSIATSAEAVFDALAAAHTEYRTGRATAVTAPAPGPADGGFRRLDDMLNRAEYVEVQDERLTTEGGH